MTDNNEAIKALETFINSSAFNNMSPKLQDDLRKNLADMLAQQDSALLQNVKDAIRDSVDKVLSDDSPLEFSLIVERKNNVLTIKEYSESATTTEVSNEEVSTGRTLAKSIGFTVVFPNGGRIKENNAKMTFVHTLVEIGLEKIANCGFGRKYSGYDLVGKEERTTNNLNWQYKVGEWFVYTYMDNELKVLTLMELSEKLGLGLKIFFDNGTEYKYVPVSVQDPAKQFKVVFPDGTVFCEDQAVLTLAYTIKHIGLERVANRKSQKLYGGYQLVDKRKKTDNGVKWQQEVDGWYVFTYFNNQRKAMLLNELSAELDLGLKVFIGNELIEAENKKSYNLTTPKAVVTNTEDLSKSTRDTSRYSFNGGVPVSKRRLAWQIVKEYIKNHPNVDYAHLKEIFVPEITTKTLGVVRSLIDMPESMPESEYPRRYMMKDEDLIELSDGDLITVCSQWNVDRIAKIIEIAKSQGWSVVRTGDETDETQIKPQSNETEIENVVYESQIEKEPTFVSEPVTDEFIDDNAEFGVTFADGSYIEEETPLNTFLATLSKIGISRIPDVGVMIDNIELVSKDQSNEMKQIALNGFYIYTDLTSAQMMDALQQISDYYYMDLEIGTEEE